MARKSFYLCPGNIGLYLAHEMGLMIILRSPVRTAEIIQSTKPGRILILSAISGEIENSSSPSDNLGGFIPIHDDNLEILLKEGDQISGRIGR